MSRWLDWPKCVNARELGGLGGRIRDNALYRSDSHVSLTGASVSQINGIGVGLVLDLRSEWEAVAAPSPFAERAYYRNVPLLHPYGAGESTELVDVYKFRIIDNSAGRVAAAIAAVADAPPGAVLVHCHAGLDRTGITTALLLGIAGVDRNSIVADYVSRGPAWPSGYPGPQSETMAETLNHIDARYGGLHSYLTGHGVSAGQLAAIRSRLAVQPAVS